MIIQISSIIMSCAALVLSIWSLCNSISRYRKTKEVKQMLNRIYGAKVQDGQIEACKDAYKSGNTHAKGL